VLAAKDDRNTVVVNALGPQFHKGLEPSRYSRPGRIPGSCNVSAATLLDPQTKAFVPLADAEKKFASQGITREKRVVAYCGGGISATIDLFLLYLLGYDNLTLYDGSMGEWAKDASLPIEEQWRTIDAELAAKGAVLAIAAMERNASAFLVEGCKVVDAFERQFMFVGITARVGRETSLLTGSCEIKDSPETATVLAVLDATNRWMSRT